MRVVVGMVLESAVQVQGKAGEIPAYCKFIKKREEDDMR
jgi:hypothetical protein